MRPADRHPTDPGELYRLLALDDQVGNDWEPGDLRAILEHQLAADLAEPLGAIEPDSSSSLEAWRAASREPLGSLGDLLRHSAPPRDLLALLKRFARSCRNQPELGVPSAVATVLYFLSIALAIRQGMRDFTELDGKAIAGGLEWNLKQDWLTDEIRQVFRGILDQERGG